MSSGQKSSMLQHHFVTLKQQYESSTMGMWSFLITEILFFGGVFLGYTVYRMQYPEAFAHGSAFLDVFLGTVNTAILIGSSLTMAFAVRAGHLGKSKAIVTCILLTLLLGALFLGIKSFEYTHKFHENLIPGKHFFVPGYDSPGLELFFSFYFVMTGLHALHMVIGMVILSIIAFKASKGAYTKEYSTPVEMMGLYWHFVDIVWIFLFPLLYLLGRH